MSGTAPELTVEGRVVPYGEWSEVDSVVEGHFMERFALGSLRQSFANRIGSRLRGYFEHGKSALFGRQPIMDIRDTWEQPDGAWYRATLLQGLPDRWPAAADSAAAGRVSLPRPGEVPCFIRG